MEKCNLIGLKSRLGEIREMNLSLETPLAWELPPFFTDDILKSDLDRIIHAKTTEINDSPFERVEIFLLETLVKYFSKTLLEDVDLDRKFESIHRLIDTITVRLLDADMIRSVREDLHYMIHSTACVVNILKEGEVTPLPTSRAESDVIFSGVKAWFNMTMYNYDTALQLFESISECTQYRPLFAFYHGKALARQRRQGNDWNVPCREIELLLEGSDRRLTLPCILHSFTDAGSSSAVVSKYNDQYNTILKKAWDARDMYHSDNLSRLANFSLRRKEVDKARELFQLAMKLNPVCSFTLHKYGNFLYTTDNKKEEGIDLMIRANHLPAFLTVIKFVTRDNLYTISNLFDKVELILTNVQVYKTIRYLMFIHSLESKSMAKATHHLKALCRDFKETKFSVGGARTVQSVKRMFSLGTVTIPEEVCVSDECSKFRKVCKTFDEWMKEKEEAEDGYEVFELPL